MQSAVISRLKIMGQLDIAERRLPQDGRASIRMGGRAMDLRSPRKRRFERRVLAAAAGTGLRVRWLADSGTGNSDHREFGLAGYTAAKLGVVDNTRRHTAADVARNLQNGTFPRVRRLVEQLLQT